MKRLVATLFLTLAVLLGGAEEGQSCSAKGFLNSQLTRFLEKNINKNLDITFKERNLTGYLNSYTGRYTGCTCSVKSRCLPPKILLLKDGSIIPLNNSTYDNNIILNKFYSKFCTSEAFYQSERNLYRIIGTSFKENEVENFAMRCKVKLTGELKNFSKDRNEIYKNSFNFSKFFRVSNIELIERDDKIIKKFENYFLK